MILMLQATQSKKFKGVLAQERRRKKGEMGRKGKARKNKIWVNVIWNLDRIFVRLKKNIE